VLIYRLRVLGRGLAVAVGAVQLAEPFEFEALLLERLRSVVSALGLVQFQRRVERLIAHVVERAERAGADPDEFFEGLLFVVQP
jgi:hypothetical protein